MKAKAKVKGPVLKPAPTMHMHLVEMGATGKHIEWALESGGVFLGTVEEVNALLTAMGYGEVAVRVNLMSSKPYIEAKGTPVYLSPACETYWSM